MLPPRSSRATLAHNSSSNNQLVDDEGSSAPAPPRKVGRSTSVRDLEKSLNLRVFARFRPVNKMERTMEGDGGSTNHVLISGNSVKIDTNLVGGGAATPRGGRGAAKQATFILDNIFGMDATQQQVYDHVSFHGELVKDVVGGFNATIFAYGQTGSGKTHSMLGKMGDENLQGIMPRVIKDLFDAIPTTPGVEVEVRCSYLEIYMETVHDLLAQDPRKTDLQLRESPTVGFYVEGAVEERVFDVQDCMELFQIGGEAKHISATKMNPGSSRSHCVFIIKIHQKNDREVLTSHLNLVDLAGSEKQKLTQTSGQTLEEAKKINLSLLCLSQCIEALSSKKGTLPPFRESKLTKLLQNSLGGNAKTTLLVTASPCMAFVDETISSLSFAERAKAIKNKPKVNKEMSKEELERVLNDVQAEFAQLKTRYDHLRLSKGLEIDDNLKSVTHEEWETQKLLLDKMNAELMDAKSEIRALKDINEMLQTTAEEERAAFEDQIRRKDLEIESLRAELGGDFSGDTGFVATHGQASSGAVNQKAVVGNQNKEIHMLEAKLTETENKAREAAAMVETLTKDLATQHMRYLHLQRVAKIISEDKYAKQRGHNSVLLHHRQDQKQHDPNNPNDLDDQNSSDDDSGNLLTKTSNSPDISRLWADRKVGLVVQPQYTGEGEATSPSGEKVSVSIKVKGPKEMAKPLSAYLSEMLRSELASGRGLSSAMRSSDEPLSVRGEQLRRVNTTPSNSSPFALDLSKVSNSGGASAQNFQAPLPAMSPRLAAINAARATHTAPMIQSLPTPSVLRRNNDSNPAQMVEPHSDRSTTIGTDPADLAKIRLQPLFNNPQLLNTDGKPFSGPTWNKWVVRGFVTVGDIFSDSGNVLWEVLDSKFADSPETMQMELKQLCKAFPKQWRKILWKKAQ